MTRLIADARLSRIESDLTWAQLDGGRKIARFSRDHGNLLITVEGPGSAKYMDLLYVANGDVVKGSAASVLQHADPDTMRELLRGYRLAKKAGLLEPKASTVPPHDAKGSTA